MHGAEPQTGSGLILLLSLQERRWGRREELGLGYVASSLRRAGWSVVLQAVDPQDDEDLARIGRLAAEGQPFLAGIGCSHVAVPLAMLKRVSGILKTAATSCHLTTGGFFATFNAEQLLATWPELDSVVCGEGEATAVELADRLIAGRPLNNCAGLLIRGSTLCDRSPAQDLDTLPWPARDAEGWPDGDLVALSTSRGCLARCTFCNVPAWMRRFGGGRWRGRSPASVIDEMVQLFANHGKRRFWIVDSSYEDPLPEGFLRMRAIAEGLIERALPVSYYVFLRAETAANPVMDDLLPILVRSGLRRVFIGIESPLDSELKGFGKRARFIHNRLALQRLTAAGLAVRAGIIMFTPTATCDDLQQKLDYLRDLDVIASTSDLFTRLELYTGSAEVVKLGKMGLLTGDCWNDPYAYRFAVPEVGALASAMTAARDARAANWKGEALHTATLVACGALASEAVQQVPDVLRQAHAFQDHLAELWRLQQEFNYLFFSECLTLARRLWQEDRFQDLLRVYVDGCHRQTAEAAETLVRAFLHDMAQQGVDIIY